MIEPKQYLRKSATVEAVQWKRDMDAYGIEDWADSDAVDYDEELAGPLDPEGVDWGLLNVVGVPMPPFGWLVKNGTSFSVYDNEHFEALFEAGPGRTEAEVKAEALDEAVAVLDSMLTASLSPDSGYVKQGRDLLRLLTERANKIRSEA